MFRHKVENDCRHEVSVAQLFIIIKKGEWKEKKVAVGLLHIYIYNRVCIEEIDMKWETVECVIYVIMYYTIFISLCVCQGNNMYVGFELNWRWLVWRYTLKIFKVRAVDRGIRKVEKVKRISESSGKSFSPNDLCTFHFKAFICVKEWNGRQLMLALKNQTEICIYVCT